MTVDDDCSMKLMTPPTSECLMRSGSCLLGEPIKTSKSTVNNRICDWVDENFTTVRFYLASWGNTCQCEAVDLILYKWYYKINFFRSLSHTHTHTTHTHTHHTHTHHTHTHTRTTHTHTPHTHTRTHTHHTHTHTTYTHTHAHTHTTHTTYTPHTHTHTHQ